ncbi:hypothetical protein AVEN_99049-1 [Araneus ventricosus]|uniref:STPR domain-containing protein n=1 Tax=Araneus ventricosus TaxID=182803 RepID=A0A4Y2FNR1_ARAVE|nr:hypothetical protein AVEN_99049-1 [Araneus ventricosus]
MGSSSTHLCRLGHGQLIQMPSSVLIIRFNHGTLNYGIQYGVRSIKEKGVTGEAARRQQPITKRERRVAETDEERNDGTTWSGQKSGRNIRKRNSRLSDIAQRSDKKRAEETKEQRNSRLSAMVQHARERRLNDIEGQNHHQIQTFFAARTVLYSSI